MYVSRLLISTNPGKGRLAAEALGTLAQIVAQHNGGSRGTRILRTHFGSSEEADFQFEQDFSNMAEFEEQLKAVTADPKFREWSEGFSKLLQKSPEREILEVL